MADPINLPAIPWAEVNLTPVSPANVSMMEGRRSEVMASLTPYWVASYKTGTLTREQSGLFDAFLMKADARGGFTFLAYDPWRPRPIAMDTGKPLSGTKSGGGAFTGQAVLQTISNSRQVVIAGLPAGFKLLPGDYIEFRKSLLIRSMHRVMEPATATNFGVVTVSILYGLDTQIFTTSAAVHFEKPCTVMMMDPGSSSAPKSLNNREISFSATEVFFS